MAGRDRFGGFAEPPTSQLQRFILNACDPQNFEPNLALCLEIADIINSKKGTAPREAATAIVNHVNNRNPNISLLALTLLDICVKNCAYPFHLQISTKEFLNELVRRFPERPPIRYTRVQTRVLELIEEWRQTICQTSRYKEDLGFIRDMHRLLSYKGYTFPEVKREDAAVLNPNEALRSAEEMEEEERAAQSAKLQELIRRGTPQDLQEANKLMKVMAGYDNRHKTDYRAKAAEEVGRIQQKAKALEDMLQQYRTGDTSFESSEWEDLASSLASAQPKIQKMCEEESDDTVAVAKLFEINDSIHRTLERYRLVQKGDLTAAANIPKGTLGVSGAGVSRGLDNEFSLIDFGGEESNIDSAKAGGRKVTVEGDLQQDLLGLSLDDHNSEPQQGIFLGSSYTSGNSEATIQPTAIRSSVARSAAQTLSLTTAYDRTIGASSSSLRQPSSLQLQGATNSTAQSNAFTDLLGQDNAPQTLQTAQNNGFNADDEWTFTSALPESTQELTVVDSNINVKFQVSRAHESNLITIKSVTSNKVPSKITELTFQLAVMKGLTLQLEPQSGRSLQPLQRNGITQIIKLAGVARLSETNIKLRWKVSYCMYEAQHQEHGEILSLR